jgi:hypothetical protein
LAALAAHPALAGTLAPALTGHKTAPPEPDWLNTASLIAAFPDAPEQGRPDAADVGVRGIDQLAFKLIVEAHRRYNRLSPRDRGRLGLRDWTAIRNTASQPRQVGLDPSEPSVKVRITSLTYALRQAIRAHRRWDGYREPFTIGEAHRWTDEHVRRALADVTVGWNPPARPQIDRAIRGLVRTGWLQTTERRGVYRRSSPRG